MRVFFFFLFFFFRRSSRARLSIQSLPSKLNTCKVMERNIERIAVFGTYIVSCEFVNVNLCITEIFDVAQEPLEEVDDSIEIYYL